MPTNRELLIAAKKKKEKGLPVLETSPRPKRTARGVKGLTGKGVGGRGIEAKAAQKVLESGIATKGIKGIATPPGVTPPDTEVSAITDAIAPKDTPGTTPGISPTKGLASLGEFKESVSPEGELSAVQRAVGAKQGTGGFVFHEPSKGGAPKPVFKSGLPTDRLPSFSELGGAIGSVFKFVSDLSKFNRARGLVPGTSPSERQRTSTATGGLDKARLSTLTKLHETAILAGDTEEATRRKQQIDAILEGGTAGAFARQADIDAINELS